MHTLPCSTSELHEECVQAGHHCTGIALRYIFPPHHHVALSGQTIVDAKVVDPKLPGVKHIAVVEIGCGKILLTVKGYHFHGIYSQWLILRPQNPSLSRPALRGGYLLPMFIVVAGLCFLLVFVPFLL